jgi:lysophospholipase L1-like esterase
MNRDSRRGTTKAFLRDGRSPSASSVVACVGDSITEGVGSADWVARLRDKVGSEGFQVVNAGVAGDLSANVLRRLDPVIQCDPDIITLMIGSNDVAAEYFSSVTRLLLRLKGIKQTPTVEWYSQNVTSILQRLRTETHARIAVIEIPMLGEDLTSEINGRVDRYNEALRWIAKEEGVRCIPLHEELVKLLPSGHVPPPYKATVGLILKVQLQYHALHRSWDDIGSRNGFVLLTDHTHLGERAAGVAAKSVADFVLAS